MEEFTNCSRPHRAATTGDQGIFEQGIVGTVERALGLPPGTGDVWFFDSDGSNTQSPEGKREFCHAIMTFLPPGSDIPTMSIKSGTNPVAVVSFR